MWTLLLNIPIARRRTLCFVLDDAGELMWSGKSVGAALTWLHEQEQNEINLVGAEPDQAFVCKFKPASTNERPAA